MNCPKCGCDTYSKKWGSCTALGCSLNHSVIDTAPVPVTRVTKPVTPRKVKPVTQGKRGPAATYASPAEKQRAYRERRKAQA